MDNRGQRYFSEALKTRLTKRRQFKNAKASKPQADEFVAHDVNGQKVPGKYNDQGQFIVEEAYRVGGRTDKNGVMLAADGSKMVNVKVKARI